MNENVALLFERIAELEQSVTLLRSEVRLVGTASLQRWGFVAVVLMHGLVASTLTILDTLLPASVVNGWMFGIFLFSSVWFSASPRKILERAARLLIAGLTIFCMLSQVKQLTLDDLPEVWVIGMIVAPFVMLASRIVLACFQTSLNAPDLIEMRLRSLSIRDLLLAATLVAILFAYLGSVDQSEKITESSSYYNLWFVITGYSVVTGSAIAFGVVAFATTHRTAVRALFAGLVAIFIAIDTWLALHLLSKDWLQKLSWVEIDLLDMNVAPTIDGGCPKFISTLFLYSVSVMAPAIMTLGLLRYQGYRLKNRSSN